jgi:FkbM family methyltransferase
LTLLNNAMFTEGLNDLETLETMFKEFFHKETYDWWVPVKAGDIVVDLGACIGMFTCRALDLGASKVYSVEPSLQLLSTTMKNVLPHLVENPGSVVPENAFIGSEKNHTLNSFSDSNAKTMAFSEFLYKHNINHIDYLKIDIEGGEYSIFTERNWDFLCNNVKHIAVEWHLDVFREAPKQFIWIRDNLLSNYPGQIRWLDPDHMHKSKDDKWLTGKWPIGWGSGFMMYLTNNG